MPRIPFAGSFVNRNVDPEASTKDQYFKNCYVEVYQNKLTNSSTVFLNKRPGMAATAETASGNLPTRGCCVWFGNTGAEPPVVFSFSNSLQTEVRIYQLTGTGTVAQVGSAIPTTASCLSLTETSISGTSNLVAIAINAGNNDKEAWYFPEGGAWTQITDVDFPTNQTPALPIIGDPVHKDGYMFIMCENGRIYNSDINSLSAWSASSFITCSASPDGGVGIAPYKTKYIAAFGVGSVEFFENIGNPSGSPLSRVGASLEIGAIKYPGISTILAVADTVYWIGSDPKTGRYGVYRLNGFGEEKISNAAIDKLVNQPIMDTSEIQGILGSFSSHGMSHIAFRNGSSNTGTHCYCIDTGMWWQFHSAAVLTLRSTIGRLGNSYFLAGGDAKIYVMGDPIYQDNSLAYTMTAQIGPLDFGTSYRKFVSKLSVDGDTQSGTSVLGVSYSDNDGASFSTERNIDLTATNKMLSRLGAHHAGRTYRFTHASNTACRLRAFDLEQSAGSS